MRRTLIMILVFGSFVTACGYPSQPTPAVQESATFEIEPAVSSTTPQTTAAAASPTAGEVNSVRSLFAYDATVPFDVNLVSQQDQDGVTVQDITFRAYDQDFAQPFGGQLPTYLVFPTAAGKYAGVLFLHQLEGMQDRREFLDEAIQLAHQGVVSILPDGLLPWKVKFSGSAEQDQKNVIRQTVELRRALDLLLSQPNVDATRIACVGHDYGAMYASLLVTVDGRLKACVLMAGDSTFSNWPLQYHMMPTPPDIAAYRQGFASLDPVNMVPFASPAAILFQFGEHDTYISKETAQALADAASLPKEISWYPTGHDLSDAARQDRLAWLARQLDLPSGQ